MTTTSSAVPYRYGTRDDQGRTPVYVHESSEPSGHVYRIGTWAHPWWAQGAGDSRPTDHRTKREAAERLVQLTETRAIVAQEQQRRRALCTAAPAGWRWASWDEIEREGYREVRPVTAAHPIYPGLEEHYPAQLADHPVELTAITTLHNGVIVVSGRETGEPGPYVLLLLPPHAALGALIRQESARYTGDGICPTCQEEWPLYLVTGPAQCSTCTADQTGTRPELLPAAVPLDEPPWWLVGDECRSQDHSGRHGRTGTVTEIRTTLADRHRQVTVDFGPSWRLTLGHHELTQP